MGSLAVLGARRSHKAPVAPGTGAVSIPIWFSAPGSTFKPYAKAHPIVQPLIDAALTLSWDRLREAAQIIWDYPVGSKEREELGAGLTLATWYINDRTDRNLYGGQQDFLYAPATKNGRSHSLELARAAKAKKREARIAREDAL